MNEAVAIQMTLKNCKLADKVSHRVAQMRAEHLTPSAGEGGGVLAWRFSAHNICLNES